MSSRSSSRPPKCTSHLGIGLDHDRAIEIDPNFPLAYNNRGAAYWRNGEYSRAARDFEKAIGLNPSFAIAHYNRAETFILLREWEKAISDFSAARKLGMDVAAAFHGEFGGVPAFEQKYQVQLPLDIAIMLTLPQEGQSPESPNRLIPRV